VTIEGQPSALASSSPAPGSAPVSALAVDDPLPPARRAWSWPPLKIPSWSGRFSRISSSRPTCRRGHRRPIGSTGA